jgi:hypothetical protein
MDCGLSGSQSGSLLLTGLLYVLGVKNKGESPSHSIKYFTNTMGTQYPSIHFQSFTSIASVVNPHGELVLDRTHHLLQTIKVIFRDSRLS